MNKVKTLLELPNDTRLALKSTMNRTDTGTEYLNIEQACRRYLQSFEEDGEKEALKFLNDLVVVDD